MPVAFIFYRKRGASRLQAISGWRNAVRTMIGRGESLRAESRFYEGIRLS
jgi:hypothetical protein